MINDLIDLGWALLILLVASPFIACAGWKAGCFFNPSQHSGHFWRDEFEPEIRDLTI